MRHPSLRNRLLLRVVLPGAALAVVLAAVGVIVIRGEVEAAYDRTLDAAVQMIAERVSVDDDNEIAVDLPPVALGMLENNAEDRIYYSVNYDGALVTGYPDLELVEAALDTPGAVVHRDSVMRGARVRLAAQARRVYGRAGLMLVEVAETRNARRALEVRLLAPLGLLAAGLLALVWGLASLGISRSLAPLTRVSNEIDRRAAGSTVSLHPLATAGVPQEALAPVVAFNMLLERLATMTGLMQRFTADASHQMRTPLAVLRIQFDLMVRRGLPTDLKTQVAEMERALVRLGHLYEQLIRLAKAEQEGLQPGTLEPMDLSAVLGELLAEIAPSAFARGQDVVFERPDEQVIVNADPFLTCELVANLLDNSINYNRPGGLIRLRVEEHAGRGRAIVEDDGPGIPPGERDRVFDRFHRIARPAASMPVEAWRVEGSGLGLAIVRSLAERLRASVTLGDRAGVSGLKVVVEFAALPQKPRERPAAI